jgi:hypothetical protein
MNATNKRPAECMEETALEASEKQRRLLYD